MRDLNRIRKNEIIITIDTFICAINDAIMYDKRAPFGVAKNFAIES